MSLRHSVTLDCVSIVQMHMCALTRVCTYQFHLFVRMSHFMFVSQKSKVEDDDGNGEYAYIHVCVCVCVCVCVYVYVCVYIHVYIQTFIDIHMPYTCLMCVHFHTSETHIHSCVIS